MTKNARTNAISGKTKSSNKYTHPRIIANEIVGLINNVADKKRHNSKTKIILVI